MKKKKKNICVGYLTKPEDTPDLIANGLERSVLAHVKCILTAPSNSRYEWNSWVGRFCWRF